jgi:hypothetical protein
MRSRPVVSLSALALVLSGCSSAGSVAGAEPVFVAEFSEPACVDWRAYDSLEEVAGSHDFIVRAELEPTGTTVTMYGEEASLHRATVTEVFGGEAEVGDVLDVVSTPASCTTGAPYPDGDPMLRDEATLALSPGGQARGSAEFVQTITPYDGVWDERPAS